MIGDKLMLNEEPTKPSIYFLNELMEQVLLVAFQPTEGMFIEHDGEMFVVFRHEIENKICVIPVSEDYLTEVSSYNDVPVTHGLLTWFHDHPIDEMLEAC